MQYLLTTDFLISALNAEGTDTVLDLCHKKEIKGWLLASSIPLLYAQLCKTRQETAVRPAIQRLLADLAVLPQTKNDFEKSLDTEDFSVSLAVSAVRAFKLDGLVTVKTEIYNNMNVQALNPVEVVELLRAGRKKTESVALLDIPTTYHEILNDVEHEMYEVIRSGHFILGPQVTALEEKIASYTQSKYAVGVSSGTDALLIALMAAGIGPGDEVITTPFTFYATVGSIARTGARPVFVDIDPVTYNMNPEHLASKITAKTRAIIPIHLYGQCADMDPILEIANKRGLVVIEDAAQAIGSAYKNRKAGAMGHYGCFSFFPTKNLGGFGDAGMVTTSSEECFEQLKILRVHGSKVKYYHSVVGGNFRLDTLQAATISAKLKYLELWTQKRRENAHRYSQLFESHDLMGFIGIPREMFHRHVYNQYVIRVKGKRDDLKKYLLGKKIATEIYYPLPLHLQECFVSLGYRRGDFPETEVAAGEALALPVYPELAPEQQEYVVHSIREFLK